MADVILRSAFATWDAVRHGDTAYPHGPGGLVVVPDNVASPLLHNGGYSRATTADLQNEIDLLETRAALLRAHL